MHLKFVFDEEYSSENLCASSLNFYSDILSGRGFCVLFTFKADKAARYTAKFNLYDSYTKKILNYNSIEFNLKVVSLCNPIPKYGVLIDSINIKPSEEEKNASQDSIKQIRKHYPELNEISEFALFTALKKHNFNIIESAKSLLDLCIHQQ